MSEINLFAMSTKCFGLLAFKESFKYSQLLKYAQLYLIANMFYFGFSELLFVPRNFDDVMAAAEAFGPGSVTMLAAFKISIVHRSKQKFNALKQKLKALSANGISSNRFYFSVSV